MSSYGVAFTCSGVYSDRICSKPGSLSSSNRPCQSFIVIGHQPGTHGRRQAEKIDESFGVMVIVTTSVERRNILPVEAEGRLAAHYGYGASVETHRHRAGHHFLCLGEEGIDGFPERREPLAFVDQLCISHAEHLLLI